MIPKNKRFSLALMLLMCLTLCLTALSEGDTEEVSITIFDENGEVVVGETPEPEVTPEPTVDPSLPVYEADGSILLTMTFAGDMTIGSNVQSSGTSIFEKELEKQKGDINFPFRNVRDILLADDLTMVNFEGTLTTEGRNPDKSKEEIEQMICDYLGCEKVLWIKDGIDPDETNGHIDDVACFVAPGEVACIWTEDKNHPFYEQAQAAYRFLSEATDAKGRKLKVHKLCLTKKPCLLEGADTIDAVEGTIPREDGEVSIASYMNFLIVNGAVILPQYGDENDAVAIEQVQKMFPDREVVGVQTKEVAFGGGNIHCITQQQPAVKK